jgi:glycosyltransferase involved in cell wall biosynthesis
MLLLDLTHTSHSRAQTGIQRVARRIWRELGAEAVPVCYDPYLEAWRTLEPWEMETLSAASAAWKRRAKWPWPARIRGRVGKMLGRKGLSATLPPELRSAGLFCPEIFSPEVARAYPRLFATVTGPRTAVFHDAIPLKFPELTPPGVVERFPSYLQELLSFDGIVAVSEESRQTLIDYWRWLGATTLPEVTIISLGSDPPPPLIGGPSDPPVVLCVSSLEGRKNHLALLEACETLWQRGRRFELHLIGIPRPETARAALERITALQKAGRPLRYDGAVEDRAVEAAYAASAFTIYPSLIEGSGLPVRESLARGKACICSGTGALGEIARGGGCRLLASLDAGAIAAAIDHLLAHPVELAALSAAAGARPGRDWNDVARDIAAWIHTVRRRS